MEFRFKDFLLSKDLVSNWENQRLVLLDDDTPAPFSPDAFAYMLDQQGVAKAIYDTYLRECGAKAKN